MTVKGFVLYDPLKMQIYPVARLLQIKVYSPQGYVFVIILAFFAITLEVLFFLCLWNMSSKYKKTSAKADVIYFNQLLLFCAVTFLLNAVLSCFVF